MKTIAIVVPTIRPASYIQFRIVWEKQLQDPSIQLITVWDGDDPKVETEGETYSVKEIMGKYSDLIYNKNDGIRNLGFAFALKGTKAETIITLDDDVEPFPDTIQAHQDALQRRVPVTWLSTASEYTRGFPYGIRNEAEVVLSHGVWEGIKDWDAATQLIRGNPEVTFYKGPIPKGVFYPMCIMNLAFKRKLTPYMYQAPMGYKIGLDRFADIWCGIESKKVIDKKGWAVVTGYSTVHHMRASNVFVNLVKEAKGLQMNEEYGKDEYFKMYSEKRERWKEFCERFL